MYTVFLHVFLFISVIFVNVNCEGEDYFYYDTTTSINIEENEVKLSETIRKGLEHFKQPDPKGLPGLNIPEPYYIPDARQSLGFGTNLAFTETALHGISEFRVLYINTQIENIECRGALVIDSFQIHGRYSLNTWLNSHKGGFTANVTSMMATAIATLGIERDGKLRANNISMDISLKHISVDFENAGFLTSVISGVFNSMGTFLFESIKPILLKDAETNMRKEINKKLDEIVGDIEFPNTISPIDMILVDVRKKIKDMKMDPFKINDYNISANVFHIKLTDTYLVGLSSLYRIGNISIYVENNTAVTDFSVGTQEIKGSTNWEVKTLGGLMSRGGNASFSIAYIRGRIILAQPLDTRKRTEMRDLDLELGNIQLGFDGAGTLDYIIEFSANILPTLLRYLIIDAIRNPVKWKIQEELNRIDVEELINQMLPKIDKMQEDGFQLSALRILNTTNEVDDDDEFFNF